MLLRPALRALSRRPRLLTEYALRRSAPPLRAVAPCTDVDFARTVCTKAGSDGETAAKMHMMFTCGKCDTRALKSFSKKSYLTGVVIATCPGCEARHLVADNLGWFGEERNIEEILAKKGVHVPVIDGTGEYAPPDGTDAEGMHASSGMHVCAGDGARPKER